MSQITFRFYRLLGSALFLFVVFATGITVKAQDALFTKDGTELSVKVVEITDQFIKYKKFDQPDGPLRNIRISDVFMIIYQDGTVEKFINTPTPENRSPQEAVRVNPNTAISGQDTPAPPPPEPKAPFQGVPASTVQPFTTISIIPTKEIAFSSDTRFQRLATDLSSLVRQMVFSPDHSLLALYWIANPDQTGYQLLGRNYGIYLYETATDTLHQVPLTLRQESSQSPNIRFSPDSRYFSVLSTGKTFDVYRVPGNKAYSTQGKKISDYIFLSEPTINTDPSIIDNQVLLYLSDETGNRFTYETSLPGISNALMTGFGNSLKGVSSRVSPVELSPDKGFLAGVKFLTGEAFLWDSQTGELVLEFEKIPEILVNLKFSADGQSLIAVAGNRIYLWDTQTGKLANQVQAHTESILSFDVSSQNLLCTSGMDHAINFWDLNQRCTFVTSFDTKTSASARIPTLVRFSPDGFRLACLTISSDLMLFSIDYLQ